MESPFFVSGECMRQNGPSRLASVSVWPWLPLLRRQTRVESPSEPGHQHRLIVVVVGELAERIDVGGGGLEFLFGQLHLAGEIVQVADEART